MTKQPAKTESPTVQATQQRIEEAAIQLLQEKGVLAGLNLREVADAAGVTRGLVYHHFGSRRGLLRSALRNSSYPRRTNILARQKMLPKARMSDFLRRSIQQPTSVELLTMLILDGDTGVIGLPFADDMKRVYERDIASSQLDDDIDVEAQMVGIAAAVFGWAIYRRSFAVSVGVDADKLDAGVERLFHRLAVNPDRQQEEIDSLKAALNKSNETA